MDFPSSNLATPRTGSNDPTEQTFIYVLHCSGRNIKRPSLTSDVCFCVALLEFRKQFLRRKKRPSSSGGVPLRPTHTLDCPRAHIPARLTHPLKGARREVRLSRLQILELALVLLLVHAELLLLLPERGFLRIEYLLSSTHSPRAEDDAHGSEEHENYDQDDDSSADLLRRRDDDLRRCFRKRHSSVEEGRLKRYIDEARGGAAHLILDQIVGTYHERSERVV